MLLKAPKYAALESFKLSLVMDNTKHSVLLLKRAFV